MRIRVYRARDAQDVSEHVFWALDGCDDRYWTAFANYPQGSKLVLVAFGTTGSADVYGQPIAALVATRDHIITGYIDLLSILDGGESDAPRSAAVDLEAVLEAETAEAFFHDEPPAAARCAALLARLRQVSKATWLMVHDADAVDSWLAQGFRVIAPPPEMPADTAVLVLAWGDLPDDAYVLLQRRGLSWNRDAYRGSLRPVDA